MAKRFTDFEKWRELKNRIFNKYNGKCSYCGENIFIDSFHIDHFIPRSKLKMHNIKYNDESNLMPSCMICNCSKNNKYIDDWRIDIERKLIKYKSENPVIRIAFLSGKCSDNFSDIRFYFETKDN